MKDLAKMKTHLVSIVIPCYNDWQYVEQAVNSALNQTYTKIEVIIVDDGSNTKTKQVLKKIEHKVTKLIVQENEGQSKARNEGIRAAKGEYIMTLDSDDYFERTFAEKAVSILSENENIKLVTCYSNLIFDKGNTSLYKPTGGELKDILFNNIAMGSAIFRTDDWKSVSGYDESMINGFEDWEFYIRLLSDSGKAYVINEALFNYRRRLNSTTSRANKRKNEILKYIYIKHKCLYISNYDNFILHLLKTKEIQIKKNLKILNSIEYRLGNILISPIKILKRVMNKFFLQG